MKHPILTFCLLCLVLLAGHCPAQTKATGGRADRLKEAFGRDDYAAFFRDFPDTFDELERFYGYDPDTGAMPLYEALHEHLVYFFAQKETVDPGVFAEKSFNIAKGGRWDSDAVGIFQRHLYDLIADDPAVFLDILAVKTEKEKTGFWYFILDSPSQGNRKEKFDALYRKIRETDPKKAHWLKKKFNGFAFPEL